MNALQKKDTRNGASFREVLHELIISTAKISIRMTALFEIDFLSDRSIDISFKVQSLFFKDIQMHSFSSKTRHCRAKTDTLSLACCRKVVFFCGKEQLICGENSH